MHATRSSIGTLSTRRKAYLKTDTVMISEWAISALGRAGIRGPIEDGLKNLVKKNLNWKAMLKKVHLCGDAVISEIDAAARSLGYDTSPKVSARAAKILSGLGVDTVEDLRRFMLANGDWRTELKETPGCGRKTRDEIVLAAQQMGIL